MVHETTVFPNKAAHVCVWIRVTDTCLSSGRKERNFERLLKIDVLVTLIKAN